jgi:TRAP-type C4-dicarboxylate transport system substrate-binding protein
MTKTGCAFAVLAALAATPAMAQDKPINLKISLWVPPSHPLVQSMRDWAADMTKESGGSITATIFPAEQLGKAFDHYDMARDGIADVSYVSPGYQPGRFPIINAPQLPFLTSNAKGGSAAVDSWYAAYAPKEMADTHFCMAIIADPGTLHTKTKVTLPTDIKGLKIRPAQETVAQMVTLLGGTNVQASIAEARDIISRGVASGITDYWNSQFLFGINDVTKFHIDFPLYTTSYVFPINKRVYDNASAAQKAVFDHHCTPEWAEKLASPWADFEHAGRELTLKAPGHTVVELTPEQLQTWKDATAPVTTAWEASVRATGADPAPILAELKKQLAAHGAAY